jgi:ADP-glucose pyrophosphorylase
MIKDTIAAILGGGKGERLYPLTVIVKKWKFGISLGYNIHRQ